jgi:hypothetical protein
MIINLAAERRSRPTGERVKAIVRFVGMSSGHCLTGYSLRDLRATPFLTRIIAARMSNSRFATTLNPGGG